MLIPVGPWQLAHMAAFAFPAAASPATADVDANISIVANAKKNNFISVLRDITSRIISLIMERNLNGICGISNQYFG